MKKIKELDDTQLKHACLPENFTFQTTAELTTLDGIIGQERAVKAFDFGLEVKMKGYNIYMSGPTGTGKTTYACKRTKEIAAKEPVPMDWCYVYNFQNPKKPLALSFQPGIGKAFCEDMEKLVVSFQKELEKLFRSDDYEKQKLSITHSFEKQQNELLDLMDATALEYNFYVKRSDSNLYFLPMKDGKPLEEEDLKTLSEEENEIIEENSRILQEKAGPILREIQNTEKECEKNIEKLEHSLALDIMGPSLQELSQKYASYERVISYLSQVQEDILKHLHQFMEEEEAQPDVLASLLPSLGKKTEEDDITLKYGVNLIVDHSRTEGAPVVITFNPTYNNLMGDTEYDSEFGNLTTDFMKIKSGLLHQANGGYLIVQAQDILTIPHAWEALRRVLKTKEINMDSLRELSGPSTAPILKPEPIPINFKVIMIGSEYFYDLLSQCDDEFDKFFKIRSDFDYEMSHSHENIYKIAQFIKGFVEREQTLEFDVSAVCAAIEYSTRLASRQDKLSTRFNYLSEILGEAHTWASLEKAPIITASHIKKAIAEKEERRSFYKEKLEEMLDNEIIMIDTTGSKIGQINGLAVLDMGNFSFGTPARITATTYVGKSGIVNIEKEARMSGQTHDKGIQIITGYLGQTYAQKFPMALSCRVCFEQNYNGIDGDSASSTELYCILSSLANLPIRQDLAVTGSVNQKGEIQAIGGVTHKIEGFFDLCKKRGLTGNQGVIIPVSNVKDLVLNEEVISAVKEGLFHIYPISHIDEGMELLMQYPAGDIQETGDGSSESIHGRVYEKLKIFAEISSKV